MCEQGLKLDPKQVEKQRAYSPVPKNSWVLSVFDNENKPVIESFVVSNVVLDNDSFMFTFYVPVEGTLTQYLDLHDQSLKCELKLHNEVITRWITASVEPITLDYSSAAPVMITIVSKPPANTVRGTTIHSAFYTRTLC